MIFFLLNSKYIEACGQRWNRYRLPAGPVRYRFGFQTGPSPVDRSLPVDRPVRSSLTGLDRYRSSKIPTGCISACGLSPVTSARQVDPGPKILHSTCSTSHSSIRVYKEARFDQLFCEIVYKFDLLDY